jgi:hypothetical protein
MQKDVAALYARFTLNGVFDPAPGRHAFLPTGARFYKGFTRLHAASC